MKIQESRTEKSKPKRTVRQKIMSVLFGFTVTIVIVAGVLMIFNTEIRNNAIAKKSNEYQITNVPKNVIEKNKEAEVSYDFDSVKPVSATNVLKDQYVEQKGNLPIIAGIAIPELGINLPIFKGMGNDELTYGAGTMKENQVMGQGNYALASHHIFGLWGSSQMLFSPLERAQKGLKIYITDSTTVYTYTVTRVELVEPSAGYVIDDVPGETLITLVTCDTLEAHGRIIVQGELTAEQAYESADASIVNAFHQQYNQMF